MPKDDVTRGEMFLRRIESLKQRMHRKIVRAFKGPDPVSVGNLIYRANALANIAAYGDYPGRLRDVMENQVEAIHAAISKLDPDYAKLKGIYCRERGVSVVERGHPGA